MLDQLLYGAYLAFLIIVFVFLTAVLIYRREAERWLTFSLEYLFVVIFVTWLFFGRIPVASRITDGIENALRYHLGIARQP
jgi:hypothetical protein